MNSRPHKRYRIVSKFRFSMFIIVVAAIVTLGVYLINAEGVFGEQPRNYERVDVMPGDTVWRIAAEHISEGEDIRRLVREIREINDLDSEVTIYAGQILRVPV
jgi:LysM repeat protein